MDEYDDEIDDEQLADQLNVLADLEESVDEKLTAEACAATIQITCEAYAAWDSLPRGKNGKG